MLISTQKAGDRKATKSETTQVCREYVMREDPKERCATLTLSLVLFPLPGVQISYSDSALTP